MRGGRNLEESPSAKLLDWTFERFTCGSAQFCSPDENFHIEGSPERAYSAKEAYGRSNLRSIKEKLPSNSLYRRTLTTAAMANDSSRDGTSPQDHLRNTAMMARGLADNAGRAIGNLIPTATLQQITARKYTLPDKTVASQVLMYRQLLHTKCRPGLKLSRPYQATAAQQAVMHMPWWEEGIEEKQKMVISYNNLITRLWLNGAIEPYKEQAPVDLLDGSDAPKDIDTFMTEEGLPPIPHTYWVERMGFQQPDPVTDFRSGGVLSLGMMVYMVESCPKVSQRFFSGDASVLPFGITCINVTDMIAKFLMLAKSTDKMDALLSQKPFWKMFGDPNAILAVQELAMTMLADVVVELGKERKVPMLAKEHSNSLHGGSDKVSSLISFTYRQVSIYPTPPLISYLFFVGDGL